MSQQLHHTAGEGRGKRGHAALPEAEQLAGPFPSG